MSQFIVVLLEFLFNFHIRAGSNFRSVFLPEKYHRLRSQRQLELARKGIIKIG